MELIIEATADGSPTLYRKDLDEHYHSVKGALAESQHVYVNAGWKEATKFSAFPISVFEVGFGTGLNAALTAVAAQSSHTPTIYHSVELFPLPPDALNNITSAYYEVLQSALTAVNEATWNDFVEINPFFNLHKIEANLLTMDLPQNIDVVYFDAFAPEKQPEMWSEEIFRKIFAAMNPGGILTTYCAKGVIRRMLQEIGFRCERLPGPPGGKREILRASLVR